MCPLLEKLVIHYTDKITYLEVCGPSLVLKHLELVFCGKLKLVKVSAPNLITLIGLNIDILLLENVPMLKEVSVNCMHCAYVNSVKKILPTLSCCISQLEILSLQLKCNRTKINLPTFPELTKMKKLVIRYYTKGDKSLLGLTPLIRSSPNLQEFVLKLILTEPTRTHREVKNITKLPHHHLRVFKLFGYYGRSSDLELVRYILNNSVVLEKMIIDPFDPTVRELPLPLHPRDLEDAQTATYYANKQLEVVVPQHVELVIL
ncbi:hypothetical protein ACP275_10G026300 [Erythranthe tilingii]